jgi:YHS domain-containing protein
VSILPSLRCAIVASAAIIATATFSVPAANAFDKIYTDDDLAIDGYDPVAYFTEGRAVEGDEAFEATYEGATWRFSSAANRDAFAADPMKYAPQYGGYCAYAVSEGYTASIDPDAWSIVDGKLYLNYSKSIQNRWQKNRDERIANADANWPKIIAGGGKVN